jgi:O-antigen ligase
LWTANRFNTIEWLWMMAGAGVVFWLVTTLDDHARRWLVSGYLVSAAIFSVYGLWLYGTGSFPRFTSSIYWPNPAAAYLMPAIVIALDGVRQSGKRGTLMMAALVLYGVAFGLCDSRAAGLVLAVAGLVYVVKQWSWRFCIKLLCTGFVVMIGIAACIQIRHNINPSAATTVPGARVIAAQTVDSNSLTDRVKFLQAAGSMWRDHMWVGGGAGTYGVMHPRYQRGVTDSAIDAHNFYAQLLAELGLVGLVLLIWLAWAIIPGLKRGAAESTLGGALTIALAALIIHFGLDIDSSYPALLWLVAILAGLIYRCREQGQPARLRMVWPTVLALAMIIIAASAYQSNVWDQRGVSAQEDSDYSAAADDFARAHSGLVFNPDWLTSEGINDLAMASEGYREGAVSALDLGQKAARLDPNDAQHWYLLGRAWAMLGNQKESEKALRYALTLEPHSRPEYARSLAELLRGQKRLAEAKTVAKTMLDQYDALTIAARSNDPALRPALAGLAAVLAGVYRDGGDEAAAQLMTSRAKAIYSGNK